MQCARTAPWGVVADRDRQQSILCGSYLWRPGPPPPPPEAYHFFALDRMYVLCCLPLLNVFVCIRTPHPVKRHLCLAIYLVHIQFLHLNPVRRAAVRVATVAVFLAPSAEREYDSDIVQFLPLVLRYKLTCGAERDPPSPPHTPQAFVVCL